VKNDLNKETLFTHIGRPDIGEGTAVNPSVTRASTLLFNKSEDLYSTKKRSYGRHGSNVHDALKDAFNLLEGGEGTSLTPSGLAACTLPILANVKAGDHLLLTDSSYGPTREFCLQYLKRMSIETTLYDPRIGEEISSLIQNNTSVIMMESPGSLTFEIQDVPSIVKVAKARNITTILDNTWAAGLSFNPLALGVDISCHAATKYFGGHSDVLYGATVSAKKSMAEKVAKTARLLGVASSPDDAYQILRGFRTIIPRFKQSEATALKLAKALKSHDSVARVLHPALPDHPDHDIWKRDFTGAACLFAVVLKPCSTTQIDACINTLSLFGVGFSYGGFESLVIHCDPQLKRVNAPKFEGPLIRFACGLENADDLLADIERALPLLEA